MAGAFGHGPSQRGGPTSVLDVASRARCSFGPYGGRCAKIEVEPSDLVPAWRGGMPWRALVPLTAQSIFPGSPGRQPHRLGPHRPRLVTLALPQLQADAPIPPSTATRWRRARPIFPGWPGRAGRACIGTSTSPGKRPGSSWTRQAVASLMRQPNSAQGSPLSQASNRREISATGQGLPPALLRGSRAQVS
jgi:hypothetical protein